MKSHRVGLTVVAIASLAVPHSAHAGILSWLDQLSGPGPFLVVDGSWGVKCSEKEAGGRGEGLGVAAVGIRAGCQSKVSLDEPNVTWFITGGAGFARRNNLNYGEGVAKPAVRFIKLGTSVDYTVHRMVDIGAGAGVQYFTGPRFPNFARVYLEPVRLGVRPLLVTSGPTLSGRQQLLGAFMVYVNWNILLGTLEGRTFGAPSDPFQARKELNRKEVGLSVDVGRLLAWN